MRLPSLGCLVLSTLEALTVLFPLAAFGEDPFLRRTATVAAVSKVGPAVVNITTARVVAKPSPFRPFGSDPFFERFFEDFFEPRAPRAVQSLGSGVLIDGERHVLTNEHVIGRASRIHVTLADGREFDATLVGADPNNDLAVLRVDTQEKLPWIPPGSASDLMVGEPVIAIGNPFGLSNTVTTGVISAIQRSIRTEERVFHGFLQTDASINPGNSGGPLLNALGELIGINTAIYGGAQGIGFAIPIDVAKRIIKELITHGEVTPVWIGLELQDVDASLAEALELPAGVAGVLVNRVHTPGPAAAAGIERGDLVTRMESQTIRSARELYERLEAVTVGQSISLELWHNGETRNAHVRAVELPIAALDDLVGQLLGLHLREGSSGGFRVETVRPGSGADQIGIEPGDLVLGINGRPMNGSATLRRASLDLQGRPAALLVVQRGTGRYHVTLPLSESRQRTPVRRAPAFE